MGPRRKVKEEPLETLQAARNMVFRRSQESTSLAQLESSEERAEAFSGEDQIDWAAHHVAQRLEQVLEMLRHSINHLDELAQKTEARRACPAFAARNAVHASI